MDRAKFCTQVLVKPWQKNTKWWKTFRGSFLLFYGAKLRRHHQLMVSSRPWKMQTVWCVAWIHIKQHVEHMFMAPLMEKHVTPSTSKWGDMITGYLHLRQINCHAHAEKTVTTDHCRCNRETNTLISRETERQDVCKAQTCTNSELMKHQLLPAIFVLCRPSLESSTKVGQTAGQRNFQTTLAGWRSF